MTPRQMAAWMQLALRRKFGEQARLLTLMRAARGDDKHFQTFLRKLQDNPSDLAQPAAEARPGPERAVKAQTARLRKAITSTAYKIASEVQQRGRIDIAQAGRFGPNGFSALGPSGGARRPARAAPSSRSSTTSPSLRSSRKAASSGAGRCMDTDQHRKRCGRRPARKFNLQLFGSPARRHAVADHPQRQAKIFGCVGQRAEAVPYPPNRRQRGQARGRLPISIWMNDLGSFSNSCPCLDPNLASLLATQETSCLHKVRRRSLNRKRNRNQSQRSHAANEAINAFFG